MLRDWNFKGFINAFNRKEAYFFIGSYLICFWVIYQIPFRFNGPYSPYEHSIKLSAFIAVFPGIIISAILGFFFTLVSSSWVKPMIELIVLMARVDGKITVNDKKVIEKGVNNQFGYLRAKRAFAYFYKIEKSEISLEKACSRVSEALNNKDIMLMFDSLVRIAVSDQFLSIKEEQLLYNMADRLKVPVSIVKSILARKSYVSESEKNRKKYVKPKSASSNKSYEILGINSSATFEEVKKAYRELAKIYHPDKIKDKALKDNAKLQFQAISNAYETLKKKMG